ncbi:hypothetical protein FC70_GL001010 [Paucilactobacillus oligofermentans DSM 15707 = LMG 22743]|uniref:Uncharacterized protein n=1 Tax=Paucilactobacillus oligofermentans DSM 15707 = LMG 22743 TaxID=1423778 RepID=A0A0R1RMV4_9LACO|nr:hypothetical protein [Paucilactobacillus oligofermentans]KRL55413.1 hypothetical protein FC70_GL001010 [Paucilactobacillus oligofermentans DSM 15707 = LMG 22743]CUS25597.1 Uncharacterized protein LACOL_0289 [Paucilactobacillus oligofermentans DSM 15707 = LMG 22743]
MTNNLFTNFGFLLLYLAIFPIIFGTFLVLVNHNSKQLTVTYFGYQAQIWLGFIGIAIHESSHLIMALIFRHKITKFRLVRFPKRNDPNDQALGYVSHSWNKASFYQRLGNLFIGIAPIIGNTLVVWLISKWLVPNALSSWQSYVSTQSISDLDLFANSPYGFVGVIIWIIILINICVGGFDLSRSDLNSSLSGTLFFLLLLVVITLFITFITQSVDIASTLQSFMLPLYSAMILAVIISTATNLILRIIALIK